MESFDNHCSVKCNAYKQPDIKLKTVEKTKLERSSFYCNRFLVHSTTLDLDKKLLKLIHRKMDELIKLGKCWFEVDFLEDAFSVLTKCRHLLMYTYAFLCYENDNNELSIFEKNQKNLEKAIEKLSCCLNQEVTGVVWNENVKKKIYKRQFYCESCFEKMIEHIEEGMQSEAWKPQFDGTRGPDLPTAGIFNSFFFVFISLYSCYFFSSIYF